MVSRIPKVNEHNEIIGETTVAEAVANGWPRRISRIFIFDGAGSMLLQKRSETMVSFPGLWDQAAAGHVDVGETHAMTAARELQEELGIHGVTLTEHTTTYVNDCCFEGLYSLILSQDTSFTLDPGEVAAVRWVPIAAFEAELQHQPEQFVPPFLAVWHAHRDTLVP